MSQITFPVERIGPIANYTHARSGLPQLEVTVSVSQTHMRKLLIEIAKSVPGETLADWLKEDFDWEVCDAPAI